MLHVLCRYFKPVILLKIMWMVLFLCPITSEAEIFVSCLCSFSYFSWWFSILAHYSFVCLTIFDCMLLIYFKSFLWDFLDAQWRFLSQEIYFYLCKVPKGPNILGPFETKFSVWPFLGHPVDVNLSWRTLKDLVCGENFLRTPFSSFGQCLGNVPGVFWCLYTL